MVGGSIWALGSPQFSNHEQLSNTVSSDGVVTLKWKSESSVILEHSRSGEFSKSWVRYQGEDQSSVLSGLAEGNHFFRFKHTGEKSEWSDILPVRVEFVDLTLMYVLLSVGGLVSILTVSAIIYGARKSRYLRTQVP